MIAAGLDPIVPRGSDRGFSLVELLVVLVAGGLLLVALGSINAQLAGELRQSGERNDIVRQIEAAQPILAALIGSALPKQDAQGGFISDAQQLSLIVPPPMAFGAVGDQRLTLRVERKKAGDALVGEITPLDTGTELLAAARKEQRIVEGVADIQFETEPWDGGKERTLPRLITIRFQTHDRRSYAISISPKLTTDGGCQFDPISLACR